MARVDAKWNWEPAFKARDQGRRALNTSAERVKARAQTMTPVDTGRLRSSAHVVMDGGRAIVAYDAEYATIVHERLDQRRAVGGPKFLENATLEVQGRLASEIASGIKL